MANEQKIKVPDIGGASGVDVIEILVNEGAEVAIDTPLITLETDKASMEIPSPMAGKVQAIHLKVGDKVAQGDEILTLIVEGSEEAADAEKIKTEEKKEAIDTPASQEEEPYQAELKEQDIEVAIPDIGGATDVDVIDVMVKEGDQVEKDQSLLTLEGDKATMDIPSPKAGLVKKVALKVGDKVSEGSLVLVMTVKASVAKSPIPSTKKQEPAVEPSKPAPEKKVEVANPTPFQQETTPTNISAGPAVRRLARELGVNLADVRGTGRKSRITKEDIVGYVKNKIQEKSTGSFALPPAPSIDFSKFGNVESKPLNKIKRLTGLNVHRSWITIPHVTQFDEADITELEAFRKAEAENAKAEGYKLTMLAFVCKVVYKALKMFPQFNSSLDESGENLIYKRYYNIGIAVETPNGLVVPVIKDVNHLTVSGIAKEMARLSAKARDKGLMPADMSGGCFTISSLGGIGGTAFTPIVNSPEVAILGLSRSSIKPIYDNGEFKPRLMLPLSLSYDHRVIDGAEAARFTQFISESLSDVRRILL
jgi:pyruvate dehydrogenase E2 component (dihydrolipoamide acetyltransferase)